MVMVEEIMEEDIQLGLKLMLGSAVCLVVRSNEHWPEYLAWFNLVR